MFGTYASGISNIVHDSIIVRGIGNIDQFSHSYYYILERLFIKLKVYKSLPIIYLSILVVMTTMSRVYKRPNMKRPKRAF
jgi:hypothetical protein